MDQLHEDICYLIARRLSGRDLRRAASVLPGWRNVQRRLQLRVSGQPDLDRLATISSLTVVEITVHVEPLTAVLLGVSRICTNLRELTIYAVCPLTSYDIVALDTLPHLKYLDVFFTAHVIDSQLIPVAIKLSTLVINERVSFNFLAALERSAITELHMMGRSHFYMQSDLRVFLEGRRDFLTSLTLRCHELNDHSYAAIAACHNLLELKLYSCHLLRWKSASRLIALTKLRVLHMTGARMLWKGMMKCFLIFLKAPIKDLCLSSTYFTDEHIDILTRKFPHLQSLELWRNKLTGTGIVKLADELKELTQLDTDVELTEEQLARLGAHGELQRVRCCAPPGAGGGVHHVGAARVDDSRRTRADGEGPRASLFHFADVDGWKEPGTEYRLPDIFDYG